MKGTRYQQVAGCDLHDFQAIRAAAMGCCSPLMSSGPMTETAQLLVDM
jgi:hypothetical protein